MLDKKKVSTYTNILKSELQPAMGCTEPISIAYAAAYARRVLGKQPEHYEVWCSGNIIKNVKAVTVPQTNGLRGIEAAVLAGTIGGNPDKQLEVLADMTDDERMMIANELQKNNVDVHLLNTTHALHIILNITAGADQASVEIVDWHTNIGNVSLNGNMLHEVEIDEQVDDLENQRLLNVDDIITYGNTVNLADIEETIQRQIDFNSAISEEGLSNPWGACVGRTLLANAKNDLCTRMKAAAAAGSDARMNGCAMPVVINSGSGNQGITVSMPIVQYAKEKEISHENLIRALCVANLLCIHIKTYIGRLSAFCGAVCAGTSAAAGIAYLEGASNQVIAQTIINSLCNAGGIVCDGAKSSCAAKIASAVECGLLGYTMASNGLGFRSGEGIVKNTVEETIQAVGRMAASGMRATDTEILNIMIET